MALNLSDEQISELKKDLSEAKPYEYDSPEMNTLDAECDYARWKATCAKKMLEQDAKEKAEAKNEKLQ